MGEKTAALVPMRHRSERVPGKNYRPFAGRPLFHHILETLSRVPAIDEIIVDTDSPVVKESIALDFPNVLVLDRPEHLREGTVPMNEVLLHDAVITDASLFVQTHSTNPLLRSETVKKALERFHEAHLSHDSLFTVTRRQTRLWDRRGRPVNHDPAVLLRTQDLEPLFEENSCLYVFPRTVLETCRNRLGKTPLMFEMDPLEAWDIDEETDFIAAEALYSILRGVT